MESGKRYIKSESATCTHIVEENDPHEKLKAMLNSPEEVEDCPPPVDAPKFGTVIHNRIFVGGFSLTATDEDLLSFFSSFAAVSSAKVIHDRAGVSKCYGFVTFVNPRVARLIVKQVSDYYPITKSQIKKNATKSIEDLREGLGLKNI